MTKPASPYNLNYIERPFDPERKRYYFAASDLQKVGDYKVLNEGWLNENGGHTSLYPKTGQIRIPAGKNVLGEDAFFDYRIGLIARDETPRIKVSLKKKPIDIYGACTPYGPFFISTRAKQLFERLDPDAFAFVPCETTTRRTLEVEPYWMCVINRVVPEFDEEKSIFINECQDQSKLVTGRCTSLSASTAFDIHMKPDMSDSYQAFSLMQFGSYFIFSEVIVDAWRAAKMTGLNFTPLQTPTKKEARSSARFLTWMYYFQTGREFWEGKI
jgi:hypothetical protein